MQEILQGNCTFVMSITSVGRSVYKVYRYTYYDVRYFYVVMLATLTVQFLFEMFCKMECCLL